MQTVNLHAVETVIDVGQQTNQLYESLTHFDHSNLVC